MGLALGVNHYGNAIRPVVAAYRGRSKQKALSIWNIMLGE